MTRIAIYGAGGFGKEARAMLEMNSYDLSFAGYIDDYKKLSHKLTDEDFDDVWIAIAKPENRHHIVNHWKRKHVPFASYVSQDVTLHASVKLAEGILICPGAKLTTDIMIERFSIINLNVTIGHDVVIGEFCSLMPSVNISGNVKLGKRVFVGSGATILQGLSIGDDAVIGAGAVVTRPVEAGVTVVGVPARPMIGKQELH